MAAKKKVVNLEDLDDVTTVGIDEAPMWSRENDRILTGYRRSMSPIDCVRSIFKLHNESLNIISHLFGAIVFLVLRSVTISSAVLVFVSGSVWCFGLSAAFHAMIPVSEVTYMFMAKSDYSGISISIVSSAMTFVEVTLRDSYVAYFCSFYQTVLSVALIVFLWLYADFHLPAFRGQRAIVFFLYSLAVNLPILIIIANSPNPSVFIDWTAVAAVVSFAVGIVFYVGRISETYFPSPTVDVFFPSHGLFHVLVVAGALFLYSYYTRLSRNL